MLKKLLFLLLAAFILAGCALNNKTLNVQPKIQLPERNLELMGTTISINGADQHLDQALAKINPDGQLVTLTPSRDLRFLMQEVLEKQMTARGYMIEPNGAVDLKITVNNLYADLTRGNLRYSIITNANISILVKAKNGNSEVKTYRQTYSVVGPFRVTNQKSPIL